MGLGRKWIFIALLALLVFAAMETLSFVTGRVLAQRGVFYQPSAVSDYASYLDRRDPEIGWPVPDFTEDPERDAAGSRIVPAYPDPDAPSCVSLYGDSFTWGSDLGADAAWGNLLAQELGCRVANYGVPGYGTDHALMRYTRNREDRAELVILAHQPENILRNVNQYRALLYADSLYGFKPRFVIDEAGALRRIGIPRIPAQDYLRFVERPETFLDHEYFAPGGSSGIRRLEFPYTWSLATAFGHFHIQSEIRRLPWFADFYRSDHRSDALPVTAGILRGFEGEARSRGQRPVVIVLPTGMDFDYYAANSAWVFQPLIDDLADSGIPVLNVGPAMRDAIADRDHCELFTNCSGHYNAEGYALVAKILANHLDKIRPLARNGERGTFLPFLRCDEPSHRKYAKDVPCCQGVVRRWARCRAAAMDRSPGAS